MPSTRRRVPGSKYTVSFKLNQVNYGFGVTYRAAPGAMTATSAGQLPAMPWPSSHKCIELRARIIGPTALAASSQLVIKLRQNDVAVGTGITLTPASAVDTNFSVTESVTFSGETLMLGIANPSAANTGAIDVMVTAVMQVIE